MIKVTSVNLNTSTKAAYVSLFSDTKAEVATTPLTDILGFPQGYTIDAGSSVMTASGDIAFMKSNSEWNWV